MTTTIYVCARCGRERTREQDPELNTFACPAHCGWIAIRCGSCKTVDPQGAYRAAAQHALRTHGIRREHREFVLPEEG